MLCKIVCNLCIKAPRTWVGLQKVPTSRSYSSGNNMKVTILGAAGNVGKSVSLMLKQSPYIDELCLYDTKPIANFVDDLNYVDTKCRVSAFIGTKDLKKALHNSSVVLVSVSSPHSDTNSYNSLFDKNATLIKDLASGVALHAPKALTAIATEPIHSIVPMFSEIMKKNGSYNPHTVFGITTIDSVRANKFVAEVLGLEPECVMVPMIGGHTDQTMVPVLSQAIPCAEFTNEELEDITCSVREAQENLTKASCCHGAYLSNSFAIARFVISLVKSVRGQPNIIECAFVKSPLHPQLKYMVSPLLLGPGGVSKHLPLPELSDYETCLFENCIPFLSDDIKKGEIFGGKEVEKPLCDVCDPNPNAPRCPPDHCEKQSVLLGDK